MLNLDYEKEIFDNGYDLIGALDEAGRGPLAGPVVAACVIIDKGFKLNPLFEKVNDSKKLSAKKRQELFYLIKDSFPVGVGICDHETIDRINILEASFLAMKKALGAIKTKPDMVILDGKFVLPNCSYHQKAIIGGDALVFSIAAASIIAKVTRDELMLREHEKYPNYGFDKHKGYGTKIHLEALTQYGPCPIHRKSFAPVKKHITQNI